VLALATAWREAGVVGNLLPRWEPNLALGFGYPFFGVYSPLAYVFPAALTLLGIAPITAVKLAVALALLLGALGAYSCLRSVAGQVAACAGAVTYLYAPYTLANAYVRLDLAELSAASCAALALGALLRLGAVAHTGADSRRSLVLAALTLATVPLCHNLSVLTFLPLFAAVWLLLVWRGLASRAPQQRAGAVLPLLAAPLLAVGLAAFFLLPAWQWQAFTHLARIPDDPAFYAKLLHPWALVERRFAVPGWGWYAAGSFWWNFSVAPSAYGEFGAGPSTLAWLAAPASLLLLRRGAARRRGLVPALALSCLLSVFLLTSLSLPFWRTASHLTLLQFPWRFAGPLCLASALLLGLLIGAAPARWRLLFAAGCITLAIVPALLYLRPDPVSIATGAITWPAQMRRELIGGYGTTGSGLFLPRWAPGQSPAVPVALVPSPATTALQVTALTGRADAFTLTYQVQQATTITLGTWYFPGWQAQVDNLDVPVSPDGSGLLRVAIPAGTHRLVVARRLTTVEIVGGSITLVAVLLALRLLLGAGRPVLLGAGAVVLLGIGLSGAVPALSFAALMGTANEPAWLLPAVPSRAQPLQAAAWRVVRSPFWGATPVLETAWLVQRAPAGNEQATIQVLSASGRVLASSTRGPRLGTVTTTGWPAGMVVFDHIPIPLPPAAAGAPCPGTFTVGLAVGAGAPAILGPVTLPCASAAVPAIPQVITLRLQGLTAGRLPAVQPGTTLQLDLTLRVPGPTAGDQVFAFQLLDGRGQPVAQTQSYGNVDLRFSTLWSAGENVPYRFRLPLPAGLAAGVYTLSLQRFAPGGALQPLAGPNGQVAPRLTLATVKVAAPSAPAGLPVAERFGSAIGLVAPPGQRLPDVPAQPGTTISVPLRWLALGTPTSDYTVFVHLLDAAGTLVAQADAPPLAGRYPTSAWAPGELVADPRQLRLPANLSPGRYHIQVGWYLPATGARLPTVPPAPDDAVTLEDVMVAPSPATTLP